MAFALGLSIILATVLIFTNGDILASLSVVGAATAILVSLFRLDWGLNILVGAAIVCDQFETPGFVSLTSKVFYFSNFKATPYLRSFDFLAFTPFEVHLIGLLFLWASVLIIRRQAIISVPLKGSALAFFAWLLISFFRGISAGGELLPAFWETRALIYLGLFYFFVPQVIRDKQQIISLIWVCILAVSVKVFQAIMRFVELGFSFGGHDSLMTTEDTVIMIPILLLFIALSLLGGNKNQLTLLRALALPMLIAFFVANRRSTYVSLMVAILAFSFMLPTRQQRVLHKVALWFIPFFFLYMVVFWNNQGLGGIPAQAVKAVFFTDPNLVSERNSLSSLYREKENYNLAVTIRHAPLLGLGFGIKYDKPLNLYLEFGNSDYIAHNSTLWLFMRTGAIGFFLFIFFVFSFLTYGMQLYHQLRDPYLIAICAISILALLNQIVVTYVEMQFAIYRNMIFLGLLMGLLPAIKASSELMLSPEGKTNGFKDAGPD
jgi:hypothetical protein